MVWVAPNVLACEGRWRAFALAACRRAVVARALSHALADNFNVLKKKYKRPFILAIFENYKKIAPNIAKMGRVS